MISTFLKIKERVVDRTPSPTFRDELGGRLSSLEIAGVERRSSAGQFLTPARTPGFFIRKGRPPGSVGIRDPILMIDMASHSP